MRVDPGLVPSTTIAAEDGAGRVWVNPANLAYDPELSWGVWGRWDPDAQHPWSAGGAAGIGGFAAGFRWQRDDAGSDFAVDLALGVRLPKRLAVGAALRVNIPADRANAVGFDLAASWRPLPWIGASFLARTVGTPAAFDTAAPEIAVGLAVRPVGRTLLLGVDYLHTFGAVYAPDRAMFALRVRPTSGLFLRASVDTTLRFGAGLELFFGGPGVGVHAGSADARGAPSITLWAANDERDENIAPYGRQVDVLTLEEAPPYLTERPLFRRPDPTWLDVLAEFDRLQRTRGIAGSIVVLGDADLPWARWEELRGAIQRVRAEGREVAVVLVGSPGNGALLAASAASVVLVHPAAEVRLVGPSITSWHGAGLLDALGIDVQVARRGAYKSGAETLTTTAPSDAERAQREALLADWSDVLVRALATGRARPEAEVRTWIDHGPMSAQDAVQLGLADATAYPDQARRVLEERLGGRVRLVDLQKRPEARTSWEAPQQIAVVYVEGAIVRGRSSEGGLLGSRTSGAETIAKQLDAAAEDPAIRAVVLRVDSPGGSAVASDEIARAVARVKAAGKPVVASFGGVAASGGYYVAAGADAIWAEPTTVTGSIGVLATKVSFGRLLDRIGVGTSADGVGRHATIDSPTQPWDPVQAARAQALVDQTYARFVAHVAAGRRLTPEAVDAVAQGRVWSGLDAREQGLVDELGGLLDALEDARRRARIPPRLPVTYVGLRERRPLGERLLPSLDGLRTRAALRLAAREVVPAPPIELVPAPLRAVVGVPAVIAAHPDESLWLLDAWLASGDAE